MLQVLDLRGESTRQEANNHTEILEEIIEKHSKNKILNKAKTVASEIYGLAKTAAAGYIAGYVLSGGDTSVATEFAEYGAVLTAGFTLGIMLPIKKLAKTMHRNIEEKLEKEAERAEDLERKGLFHRYKPDLGLDFKNHASNFYTLIKNGMQSAYWGNLVTAKKPTRRLINNVLYGALVVYLASLAVDLEVNIIDLVTINPIEKGLDLAHYGLEHMKGLTDYISLEGHQHIGDFNQWHMLCIGAASGMLNTAKQFVVGNYQRLRAKLRKSKK